MRRLLYPKTLHFVASYGSTIRPYPFNKLQVHSRRGFCHCAAKSRVAGYRVYREFANRLKGCEQTGVGMPF